MAGKKGKRHPQQRSGHMLIAAQTMGAKHCHADCENLEHERKGYAYCALFKIKLKWDGHCTKHGNLRCIACISLLKQDEDG